MEISLEDFNALSAEQSRREVQIARLGMELENERQSHARETSALVGERDALWEENNALRGRIADMERAYDNMRYENLWMKHYILLSVEKVQYFFSHIRNIEVLSAVKAFVLGVLPESATAEEMARASKAMELPMEEAGPQFVIETAGDVVAAGGVKNVRTMEGRNYD